MTALEIVQNAYPGIPQQILLQFEDLLPAEASAIDIDFAKADSKFYASYIKHTKPYEKQSVIFDKILWPMYGISNVFKTVSMLNPQNAADTVIANYPCEFEATATIDYNGSYWTERGPYYSVKADLQLIYDRRIFGLNGITMQSKTSFHVGAPGNPLEIWYGRYPARTASRWIVSMNVHLYRGIESIKILFENGIVIRDVNYNDVYTFCTYINAYKKFATQIEAEKSLLEKDAANTVNNYKKQLDDQANRELADLQSKKIQLLIAIDNEAKSAQRDFQNMLLTAQSLKTQLGASIARN
jgi:hypothetical protein